MQALPDSLAEAARMIAARAVSPVELARIALARTARLNPSLHAFIRVTEEIALRQARAAEARQMAGALRSRLDGIPVAHKDLYETAGIPTTAHSRLLMDHVPQRDAATVAAWAQQGAMMLGKLATFEFAMGGPSFDLPWPPARNPWDTTRFTGGSSTGTAAAVAAGLILGGTGSDTGGSIRLPAALCGIAGVKPTYGSCSRRRTAGGSASKAAQSSPWYRRQMASRAVKSLPLPSRSRGKAGGRARLERGDEAACKCAASGRSSARNASFEAATQHGPVQVASDEHDLRGPLLADLPGPDEIAIGQHMHCLEGETFI